MQQKEGKYRILIMREGKIEGQFLPPLLSLYIFYFLIGGFTHHRVKLFDNK